MTMQGSNHADSRSELASDMDCAGRFRWLAWPVAILVAIMVHQVTGSPIAAASLLAVHAGWKSFRCGLWLKSVDPVLARAWACFWFYLATAFWKAAAWALATVFLFVVVAIVAGQPPGEEEIIMEFFVLGGGICLSTAIGILALASALRGGVRVWVHSNVRERCHSDFSQLGRIGGFYVGPLGHGFNHAVFVVATSLAVPVVGFGTALLIWSAAGARPNDAPLIPTLLGFLILFPGSLLAIPAYAIIARRVIAKTPAECWGDGTGA
jgi:hypothetical protein